MTSSRTTTPTTTPRRRGRGLNRVLREGQWGQQDRKSLHQSTPLMFDWMKNQNQKRGCTVLARGPMSPASGLLALTSCPYSLPLGLREGCFCPGCPPSMSQKNLLGLEADAALHYSSVFHRASGAPPSPGSPCSCW
uniref:Fibronectin type III domain containing 4 n=1 Tax=Mus spicilegus TaxID=10103 RepID=A0A8C6HB23_MUSSI